MAADTGPPDRSLHEVIPNFVPGDLVGEDAVQQPDGPILFAGDLTSDEGVGVLIAGSMMADRRRRGRGARALDGVRRFTAPAVVGVSRTSTSG